MSVARTVEQRLALLEDQVAQRRTQDAESSNYSRDLVRELKILNGNLSELTREITYLRGQVGRM